MTTAPGRLLHDLESAGFTVRYDGTKFFVSPSSKLTAAQRQRLQEERESVLELLSAEAEAAEKIAAGWEPFGRQSTGRPWWSYYSVNEAP
jgi:hypothetical protein